MMPVLLADIAQYIFGMMMFLTALFLILLVLVQRGKGGGLAGAFGGMGGQSAFGTKAGDTFTRVTIGVAFFWIVLCVAAVKILGSGASMPTSTTAPGGEVSGPAVPGNTTEGTTDGTAPATGAPATGAPTTDGGPAGEAPKN